MERVGQNRVKAFGIHFLELLPELSADAVSKRRQQAQQTKREKARQKGKDGKGEKGKSQKQKAPKGRRCSSRAANCGGGSLAKGLVPHHAETDGVSLCINYRREQAGGDGTGSVSDRDMLALVQDFKAKALGPTFSRAAWVQEQHAGEGTSAQLEKRPASPVAGGQSKRLKKGAPTAKAEVGQGALVDKWGDWAHVNRLVERNDKGWVRVRWQGEPATLPTVGALDPGRANLFFGAVRTAEAVDLAEQKLPHWSRNHPQGMLCVRTEHLCLM